MFERAALPPYSIPSSVAEISCSFCNKSKREVAVMISGINAHICEKCVGQAQHILDEEASLAEDFVLI